MTDFVIADLHFGDERVRASGRRQFADVCDMEEAIVRRWNQRVSSTDTVYVLGDVGYAGSHELIRGLNGTKHLVAGNCDRLGILIASRLFETVSVVRRLPGALLTHIPVHPSQLRGQCVNVHGHLHSLSLDDPRYRCVSVEQTGYAPLSLQDLMVR